MTRNNQPPHEFLYGVKTTGIFCRSNCPSRLPHQQNVVLFGSVAEAFAAGYRPCKRCRPDGPTYRAELDARVLRACQLLEQAPERTKLQDLARVIGMSPFHFHRLFKRRLGLTPREYQAAQRLARFKSELRRGRSVSGALYESGFGSAGRAYDRIEAKLGMKPRQYQAGGRGVNIAFGFQQTSLGLVLLAASSKGVCAIQIGDSAKALRDGLRASFPQADLREDKLALGQYFNELAQYLAAPARGLELPLDVRGTTFQWRVWQALQKIPAGKTASYQEIARKIGAPDAIRAIGQACSANKIALAIPCHRAVRADGSLGGYRWGVNIKKQLLQAESRPGA